MHERKQIEKNIRKNLFVSDSEVVFVSSCLFVCGKEITFYGVSEICVVIKAAAYQHSRRMYICIHTMYYILCVRVYV